MKAEPPIAWIPRDASDSICKRRVPLVPLAFGDQGLNLLSLARFSRVPARAQKLAATRCLTVPLGARTSPWTLRCLALGAFDQRSTVYREVIAE